MTVSELIDSVVQAIGNQFYADDRRSFVRDQNALVKCVARYGYECNQRGWNFEAEFIQRDLLDLLNQIKRTGTEVQWFPIYLQSAVDRHVRQRAEELSAKAKASKLPNAVKKVMRGLEVVEAVREPTQTEVLAEVYQQLAQRKRQQRAALKRQPKVKELDLFAA